VGDLCKTNIDLTEEVSTLHEAPKKLNVYKTDIYISGREQMNGQIFAAYLHNQK
jgi:hypothetical protein